MLPLIDNATCSISLIKRIPCNLLRGSSFKSGDSMGFVKEQSGHHSIKVAVDIYGHFAPEVNNDI